LDEERPSARIETERNDARDGHPVQMDSEGKGGWRRKEALLRTNRERSKGILVWEELWL